MFHKELVCEFVDWIHLAQNTQKLFELKYHDVLINVI